MLDECRHVFLDIGANRGQHLRYLYEPSHAWRATSNYLAWQVFEGLFGERHLAENQTCAVAF